MSNTHNETCELISSLPLKQTEEKPSDPSTIYPVVSTQALIMADRTYDPSRHVRDDDCVLVSKKQTNCCGCSEYVLKTQLCFRHIDVGVNKEYHDMYHGPCWMKSAVRPRNKALSDYEGFHELPASLQDEVKSLFKGSPKSIFADSFFPIPFAKPKLGVVEPKRCLGINRCGTRCRLDSSCSYAEARCLRQQGCYTCGFHKNQPIEPAAIEEYERRRETSSVLKLIQYFFVEDINKERRNKRARTAY